MPYNPRPDFRCNTPLPRRSFVGIVDAMITLSQRIRLCLVASGALLLAGCPTIRTPDLLHPGPAGYQRANALQWDPYPLDDVAPPVDGGRPREYARPIPEVTRGQAFTPKRPVLQPIPWPTLTVPSLPAAPAQPAFPYAPAVPTSPSPSSVRPPY